MKFEPNIEVILDKFDDLWGFGDPAVVEKKFRELLPQAEALPDKSIYLQILSQIALAQALQKKFNEAHETLDNAQALLAPAYDLARVRILLERGRVFGQSEQISQARACFEQSFELSAKNKFDFHTINAAHMIAIVAQNTDEKIKWNQCALDLATSTDDKRASVWLGSLYNNLGRNYLELKQLEKALLAFQNALECRQKEEYAPNVRVATWAVASVLRLLGRLDDALAMQHALLKEYEAMAANGSFDMPVEMVNLTRGWVYEELAELYAVKHDTVQAAAFARLAYDDLSHDEMFKRTESKRLERLRELSKRG